MSQVITHPKVVPNQVVDLSLVIPVTRIPALTFGRGEPIFVVNLSACSRSASRQNLHEAWRSVSA